MNAFEDAYRSWRSRPFPVGSRLDALDELHADLAVADTWVAETVVPFAEQGIWDPAVPDVLGTLGELQSRAVEIAQSTIGEERERANDYQKYLDLMRLVYEAFLAEASHSHRGAQDES